MTDGSCPGCAEPARLFVIGTVDGTERKWLHLDPEEAYKKTGCRGVKG